jgi:hypothetical protein
MVLVPFPGKCEVRERACMSEVVSTASLQRSRF